MERIPYQVTTAAGANRGIEPLPVAILLEDVRSAYNVGSFFRTADAAGIEKLYLAGITATPPNKGVLKTALGADATVPWQHLRDAGSQVGLLRQRGYQIAGVETSLHAVDLFDWVPAFPVCVIFGNEIEGIRPETAALADLDIRIPMLGQKHSLNVATAGGVVIYELLRKYRELSSRALRLSASPFPGTAGRET